MPQQKGRHIAVTLQMHEEAKLRQGPQRRVEQEAARRRCDGRTLHQGHGQGGTGQMGLQKAGTAGPDQDPDEAGGRILQHPPEADPSLNHRTYGSIGIHMNPYD